MSYQTKVTASDLASISKNTMNRKVYRFPNVRFDYSAEDIPRVIKNTIERMDNALDRIAEIPIDQANFENIVHALSLIDASNEEIFSAISFLQNVSTDPIIREAAREAEEAVAAFAIRSAMREQIYERVKHINDHQYDTLGKLEQRLVDTYMEGYEACGLSLRLPRRERLRRLMEEQNSLQIRFERHCSEDSSHLIFTTDELDGAPDDFLKRTQVEGSENQHKVTYKVPDASPVLKFCHNSETRRRVAELATERCPENVDILLQLHRIRTQIAQELGYSNSTDYRVHNDMVGSAEAVEQFLLQVLHELSPASEKHVAALRLMKQSDAQKSGMDTRRKRRRIETEFHSYDYAYYHNRYMLENYQLDSQKIREYFPAEHVLQEMLKFYAEMFHLSFVKLDAKNNVNVPKPWHDDVLAYWVGDSNGEPFGLFYLDLYPRDGKYTHYAMWDIVKGHVDVEGRQVLPMATVVGNFPPPDGDTPGLMDIGAVSTLFHEFGHVLHGICGGARNMYAENAGTSTETDFVEAPSQMKEQWCYEPAVLARISKHYKTGERLPDDMIQRMTESRYVGESNDWSRTASYALIDNRIFSRNNITRQEMLEIARSLVEQYRFLPCQSGNFLASWGHIGSYCYDSKYYSYTWTIVLACDLYSRFRENPLDRRVGLEYRQKILEPGGTLDGIEMIRNFLGRNPTLESYLRHYIGIEPSDPSNLILRVHDESE